MTEVAAQTDSLTNSTGGNRSGYFFRRFPFDLLKLDRLQSEISPCRGALLHQILPRLEMIRQNRLIEHMRSADGDADGMPDVERLVLGRRPLVVREKAAPTAFDPADDDRRVGPIAQDMPNALSEQPERLLLGPAQPAFGKNHQALPRIQDTDRGLQLRHLASKHAVLHPDGVGQIHHRPTQSRHVEEVARHHRNQRTRDHLGEPHRIEVAAMIRDDDHRPPHGKGINSWPRNANAVQDEKDNFEGRLDGFAPKDPPARQRHDQRNDSDQPNQGSGKYRGIVDRPKYYDRSEGCHKIVDDDANRHAVGAGVRRQHDLIRDAEREVDQADHETEGGVKQIARQIRGRRHHQRNRQPRRARRNESKKSPRMLLQRREQRAERHPGDGPSDEDGYLDQSVVIKRARKHHYGHANDKSAQAGPTDQTYPGFAVVPN